MGPLLFLILCVVAPLAGALPRTHLGAVVSVTVVLVVYGYLCFALNV